MSISLSGIVAFGAIADYGSRKLYRRIFSGEEVYEVEENIQEDVPRPNKEVVEKAAEKLGVNVDAVGFAKAQAKFYRKLLAYHPDKHPKHPDISEDEKNRLTDKITDILACWLIVREYYNDQGRILQSDCDEGYIKIRVLKSFDAVLNRWRTVRTFFDNINLGRDVDPGTERLEHAVIYV